ncbi:MAG TPA: hypothetical protein VL633_05790 [Bacteroidota bacterium]|nr:hypothetical protein [Bacteroidota bacterium]
MRKIMLGALALCLVVAMCAGCKDDTSGPGPGANPYAGNWTVSFSGAFSGSRTITIGSDGTFSFSATASGLSGPVTWTGTVSATGAVSADATYQGQSVGYLSGNLSASSGNGTYSSAGGNGTWSATKL